MIQEKLRILLCEDDENFGVLLQEYLNTKGFDCDLQPNGEEGYRAFVRNGYDICLLDVMMPKKDGFQLAEEIRQTNSEIPIIFLTAKQQKEDVIRGFKIGADDYLTKPFSMEELIYRIESIMRRVKGNKKPHSTTFRIGEFTLDTQKQLLYFGERETKLTTKENELLGLLAQNANHILERQYALKSIWVDDNYFNARSMDVYITKLRKLLQDDPEVGIINVHGKGYKLITPNVDVD